MRNRNATAVGVLILSLVVASCGRDEPSTLPDPVVTGTPVELADPSTPAVEPDAASGFAAGQAAVAISGAVNASESYPSLGLPALWQLPPGEFQMTWRGPDRELSLGGVSFTAQQPTSPERVLTFVVRAPEGPIAFDSDAGECLVTISPALPDRIGGSFLCSAVTGTASDGTLVTAAARGSFAAE
jgi:hypothetical protein